VEQLSALQLKRLKIARVDLNVYNQDQSR
jgi:hypothetical protein